MDVYPNNLLNSDASENVAYNIPEFPAYIKKGQLSGYPDFRAVSHWHDDLESLYANNTDTIHPFAILENTVHIFRLLSENMNFCPDHDKNTDELLSLTAMMGYVQKNYTNKILLKQISSAGNCCKTKCTLLFQKYLNMSPMAYLNHYRLEKSALLLQNTSMSVTEIAYTCGFSNTSYFCEIFRKYYLTTPKHFRDR